MKEKHGDFFTFSEEEQKTFYDYANKLSEGEGLVKDDYHKVANIRRACRLTNMPDPEVTDEEVTKAVTKVKVTKEIM